MKIVHATTWSLLFVQFALLSTFGWTDLFKDARTEDALRVMLEQEEAAGARADAVENEIAELRDHDWAGTYRPDWWGGPILSLAPVHGLVVWNGRGCAEEVRIENHGDVAGPKEQRIEVALVIDPRHEASDRARSRRPALDPVLILVRWCDRRYLVAQSEMIPFCNEVSSLADGADVSVGFVRDAFDRNGYRRQPPVSGLPDVPEPWRRYLLDRPIEATLVSIDPPKIIPRISYVRPPVRVTGRADRGSASGLLPGMSLRWEEGDLVGTFDVTSVDEEACSLESIGSEWSQAPDRLPPIGTRLTAGPAAPR